MRISPVVQSLTEPLLSPLVSAITGVIGGGFNPRSLFNDGSIGVLYDNNDLATMFVDAAGTTPATVNGLVGLQLDKSANLALGAELVTNGDFAGGTTGWTSGATFTSTAAVSSGELRVTATAAFGRQVQQFSTTAGKWYKSTATIRRISGSGYAYLAIATSGEGDSVIAPSAQNATATPVTVTLTFLATASTTKVCLSVSAIGDVGGFDNVSVVELAGNHRYQTTTGSKPVLRGTPTGGNLAPSNGDFSSSTGWSLQAGWTISGGTANVNSAVAGSTYARATGTSVVGRVYRIKFTITSHTSGGISACAGTAIGPPRTSAGTYVEYIVANTTDGCGVYGASTTTVASVDNIEIHDVTAGSVTAPYGLQYDGVDDFLQTTSVNFSATDKMFVCAGVRKLSDAARGMLIELGNVPGANTFRIEAPPAAVAAYTIISGGSALASLQSASSFSAPITNVVTGVMDIAADSLRMRLNGSEQTPVSTDQGTGNFSNNILYFGRRGGASLPFNGLDFGFVIKGGTTTAAQISSTERWMAQRTGVSI